MREFSSPTLVCSATTTLTIGPTNRPTCPPTRPGSSMDCASSGFPPRSSRLSRGSSTDGSPTTDEQPPRSWGADSLPPDGMVVVWSSTTMATARIRWAIPARRASTPTTALKSGTTTSPRATYIDKMAFSLTGDLGCQYGGGVSCTGDGPKGPKQAFLGWMGYDRIWWGHDKYGLTYGGGKMNNPGRYLTLLPPIDGADAVSGIALLYGESRRQGQNVGHHAHLPMDAQRVHHLVAGSRLSPLGYPVLYRPRRDHAAGRKQRFSPILHLHERLGVGDKRPPDCGSCLRRRHGQRLVPGSSQDPGRRKRRSHGEILAAPGRKGKPEQFSGFPPQEVARASCPLWHGHLAREGTWPGWPCHAKHREATEVWGYRRIHLPMGYDRSNKKNVPARKIFICSLRLVHEGRHNLEEKRQDSGGARRPAGKRPQNGSNPLLDVCAKLRGGPAPSPTSSPPRSSPIPSRRRMGRSSPLGSNNRPATE